MEGESREARLRKVFGTPETPGVDEDSLALYQEFLRNWLEEPCFVFVVHEDGAPFEALELLEISEELDAEQGLLAVVRRTSDSKQFVLPLAQLECPVEDATNHELIDDYCQWFVRSILPL
jgi:hypothetical protein